MIDVIIGVHNGASTLAEALDSLLAQTETRWRAIVCDDGSTDATADILAEYATRFPRHFTLTANPVCLGLNATLNRCLSLARAPLVARMDADDISEPGRFAAQLAFLESHPGYAFVTTPMIYFDDSGEFRRGTGGYAPKASDLVNGSPFCHATAMIRLGAYRAVGGYTESPRLLRVEDYDLWFKLYAAGLKGYILPEPLYRMRDDRAARRRRTLRNRLNEVYVRLRGYRMLGIPLYKRVYALRPLLVAMLPAPVYRVLHRL